MILKALFIFVVALAATMSLIALLRRVAGDLGLVDHPTSRKDHSGSIPLVGGIAIWCAFAICVLIIGLTKELAILLLVSGSLTLVGAIDDVKDLPATRRLALHMAAALILAVFGKVLVTSLGDILVPGLNLDLGILAIPFTVFAIVALVNAANMSDGLDGLCGMQVLVPFCGLLLVSAISGDERHLLPLVAICGCMAGFLYFNLRRPSRERASVFLGDAGSNFLGLLLAWFLIEMSQGSEAVLRPVTVLWFAPLLIYDTLEVIARRILRGESPFAADREHMHHVFLLAKFSVSETVFTMAGITLISVLIGIGSLYLGIPDIAMFIAFILIGVVFLRWIFHTWSVMRFLQRSICRRRGDRRSSESGIWAGENRRTGNDRRRKQQT